MSTRIINPSKYLRGIVVANQSYCIGFGVDNLTKTGKESPQVTDLISGKQTSVVITGASQALKQNTKGKHVRKVPPEKESRMVHISYFSRRSGRQISFDREFNVWKKELLHNYNLILSRAITPQNELILHFPIQKFVETEDQFMRAGAAMNMAIQLGSYYLVYDENLEPIIPITTFKDKSILPPGKYGTLEEKIDAIEKYLEENNDDEEGKGNSYRFATLKGLQPTEVVAGKGRFNDYLMFEFANADLIILENLKSGNATYVFKHSLFDFDYELDKSNAKSVPSFIQRIVHENMLTWNTKLRNHFK